MSRKGAVAGVREVSHVFGGPPVGYIEGDDVVIRDVGRGPFTVPWVSWVGASGDVTMAPKDEHYDPGEEHDHAQHDGVFFVDPADEAHADEREQCDIAHREEDRDDREHHI